MALLVFSAPAKELQIAHSQWRWKIFLHEESRRLFCYGPGFGSWGEEPRQVAEQVDEVWGAGSRFGPVIVYRRGVEYRWVILRGNTGARLAGGVLFYARLEEGYATGVVVRGTADGALIDVLLEQGKERRWRVDPKGRKILKREVTPLKR